MFIGHVQWTIEHVRWSMEHVLWPESMFDDHRAFSYAQDMDHVWCHMVSYLEQCRARVREAEPPGLAGPGGGARLPYGCRKRLFTFRFVWSASQSASQAAASQLIHNIMKI